MLKSCIPGFSSNELLQKVPRRTEAGWEALGVDNAELVMELLAHRPPVWAEELLTGVCVLEVRNVDTEELYNCVWVAQQATV